MEKFNKMMDMINSKKEGTELAPDTDTDTGSYGNASSDTMEQEAPQEEKLVIKLEGGVEIHLPTAVYEALSVAMNGAPESDEIMPASPCMGGGPEMDTGEAEESEKEECPFAKDDSEESESEESDKSEESESDDKEDDDDDDKPVEEGCGKHKKSKKGKK